jgi:hypothetical protein
MHTKHSTQAFVEKGSIHTTTYRDTPSVGRYQGNGRFGSVFSRLGLHAHPDQRETEEQFGRTQLNHSRHWGRFHFYSDKMQAQTSADYLLPTLWMYWERTPENVKDYVQTQSFWDGTLNTSFAHDADAHVALTSWFDPVDRDLMVLELDVSGTCPAIVLSPATDFSPYTFVFPGKVQQTCEVTERGDNWVITLRCDAATPAAVSTMYLQTNAKVEVVNGGVRILPIVGRNRVAISYGKPIDVAELAFSRERTARHWHKVWDNAASFDFPDKEHQQVWIRSHAYFMYSYNDDGISFGTTNGMTGNMFPMTFPQDMFYMHPVLLATGQIGTVKAWIERFSSQLADMQRYAKHLWPEVEGIFPAWELPFGDYEGYHQPSVPIIFCYEPHNVVSLTRMAHDMARLNDDPAWTSQHAVPLIRETALFYKSICRKESDGLWHTFVSPSVGQDERGGRHQKDYLCSLYSAKYAFQIAIEYGLDQDGSYQQILDDGLAFASLLDEQGFYYASAGAGQKDFGLQKHPVQLNGLAFLAIESEAIAPELIAHRLRYETTVGAKDPFFWGWTLGEFLLASSRAHDAAGWRKDWAQMQPAQYCDPDWIAINESSTHTTVPFYLPTHALVMQSLYSNVVCDFWGKLVIGGNHVYDEPVRFANFRSVLGVVVSGEVSSDGAQIELLAWKDCCVIVNDVAIELQREEPRNVTLSFTKAA